MRRLPPLVVSLVGLLLIAGLACDGSNGGAGGPTPEGTIASPEATVASPEATVASPEASPSPDASPEATEPPAPTPQPSVTVTPPSGVRLAVLPENYFEFLNRLGGSQQSFEPCAYEKSSGLVDCTALGLGQIQLDPPMSGSGVECSVLEREGKLVAILCRSEEPVSATFYEVME